MHRSFGFYSLRKFAFIVILLVTAFTFSFDARAANIWTFTDSMGVARSGHTATLLGDGRVVVIGGSGPLDSAEIYDPTSETFAASAAALATARSEHTATLLPDGTVLVVGGTTGTAVILDDAEIYDPTTDTFTTVTDTMASARHGHTATLLNDGTVLIAGGSSGSGQLSTAEIYDPVTGMFSPTTGTMAFSQYTHEATLLDSGNVLLTGGYHPGSSGGGGRSEAQTYDPVTGLFSATTNNMTGSHNVHTATRLSDGRVLVVGGLAGFVSLPDVDIYDPATDTFSAGMDLNTARFGQTATRLADGNVLIAGGTDFSTTASLFSTEIFASATGTFSNDADLNAARSGHTETLLADGRVLVTGGISGISSGGTLASAELYESDCPEIAELLAALTDAEERIAELESEITATNNGLQKILNGVSVALGHPGFVIPGGTKLEKLQKLVKAIAKLNHGQKEALYRNLRGSKH